MNVSVEEWIRLIKEEYFNDFVSQGGSAVKIVITPSREIDLILQRLKKEAENENYYVVSLNSAKLRIDWIDKIFHVVSRQIGWDILADRWIRQLLEQNGLHVKSEFPLSDLETLASDNSCQKPELLNQIKRILRNTIHGEYSMCKDFRTALLSLCVSLINPQDISPNHADLIKQWLKGEEYRISALKPLLIYQRIGKHNARMLLSSLAYWLKMVGYSGLVILIDLNAVVCDSKHIPDIIKYSRNAVLDTYESLRQFIDDIDETPHMMLFAISGNELLEDSKRNLDNYDALKLRVVNDVRVLGHDNPLNTLVILDSVTIIGDCHVL
jgi:hypothetical protein